MPVTRRSLLASAAAVGVVSASGRVFSPAIAQTKPLRVGILAPRSGIAAAPGLNGIRATQWAVERYNAQGGIGGRKVELVAQACCDLTPLDRVAGGGREQSGNRRGPRPDDGVGPERRSCRRGGGSPSP